FRTPALQEQVRLVVRQPAALHELRGQVARLDGATLELARQLLETGWLQQAILAEGLEQFGGSGGNHRAIPRFRRLRVGLTLLVLKLSVWERGEVASLPLLPQVMLPHGSFIRHRRRAMPGYEAQLQSMKDAALKIYDEKLRAILEPDHIGAIIA